MTTIADFRTNLREDYLKDPFGKIWSNSMVDRAINKGQQQIEKDVLFESRDNMDDTSYSTVAGTQTYALPSDWVRVRLLRYNGQRMYPKDLIQIKKENPTFVQGQPYWYYIYGSNLGVYPIPNTTGTLDMEYFKKLPKITDAQECVLPEAFDDAIMAYAAYRLMLGNRKPDAAKDFRQQYEDQANTLRLQYMYNDMNMKFDIERSNGIPPNIQSAIYFGQY